MLYDLLIKHGTIIDPAQGLHEKRDVGILQGKIKTLAPNIPPSEAKRVIDIENLIVTPGLIDLHCHCAGGIIEAAADPDIIGVSSGVTTLCDAGSTGWANFEAFRKFVISQSRTDIFCFLHLCSNGLSVVMDRQAIGSWHDISPDAMLRVIEDNRNVIKGIKIRAVGAVVGDLGIDALKTAKEVAVRSGLPLMVHIGNRTEWEVPKNVMDGFNHQMIDILDKGDIISHIYTCEQGSLIGPDGSIFPGLREAIKRGVILDTAIGRPHFSFEITKKAIEQGIIPDTLSTDISQYSLNHNVFDLATTMSKFVAAGLTLDQVIKMTTINAALALREEQRRGSLEIGMPADISILELSQGKYIFSDGIEGKTFKGDLLIVPRITIKNGNEILASSGFRQAEN